MSTENLLWGAPRIHGELLKLGFSVAQSSVAKYMVKRRGPPSQEWRTFLRNHAPDIAAMDLFVVPTIGFKLLYGFVILRLDRRDLVWIGVTRGFSLGWRSALYDPRSGSNLRHCRHAPTACHGYSRQAHCTSFTLAEWLCRAADRIDPARVFGPHHCLGQGTSASDSEKLCGLLQRRENASVFEQGYAYLWGGSAIRRHKFARHTGRTSSSIRSDLDFRYTQRPDNQGSPAAASATFPAGHDGWCGPSWIAAPD